MKAYRDKNLDLNNPRIHPWTEAVGRPNEKYYDFKTQPELIPQVLEDFKPFENYQAIQTFYELARWLNSSDSVLESNDCALGELTQNVSSQFSKKLQWSGRLMVFYRNLAINTSPKHSEWLLGATEFYLSKLDSEFEWGAIGLSFAEAAFAELNNRDGREVVINFWAFGDTKEETAESLGILFTNLLEALKSVSLELKESDV